MARFPAASVLIILANLVAAFALVYDPNLAVNLGFDPEHPTFFSAVASIFLHQNVFHLLGNMLFLAAVGAAVEIAAGTLRFALVYFLGGFVGVLAHWIVFRRAAEPPILIGASAAVASCIGYYSVRYMNFKVPIAPHRGVRVAYIVAAWAFLQVVGALIRLGDADAAVAYWAHLGGFAIGLVLSVVFLAPKLAELELGHEVLKEMNQRSAGATLAAAQAHLSAHPEDVTGLREKAVAHSQLGDCEEEAETIIKLLDKVPESQQTDLLARLNELDCLKMLPSLRRTLLAERFKTSDPTVAAALLASVVKGAKIDPQRPDALLALAGIELDRNPGEARMHLDDLMQNYPLHPAAELARARGWAQ